jgi:hypothetical protein
LQIGKSRFKVQRGAKKAQGKGLGHYYAALVRGGQIARDRLAHFLMNGERGKGKRHYKRHGKNYRVHISIKSSRTFATVLLQSCHFIMAYVK